MSNLLLKNLKVFEIDDGEEYFILARNEEQARNYYENSGEIIDKNIKEELRNENGGDIRKAYDIKEIMEKSNREIEITDDEQLLEILHKGFPDELWNAGVKVLDYAKYIVFKAEIRKEKLKLPMLIGGSDM